MRTRLIVGWIILFSLVAAIGYAQQPAPGNMAPAAASAATVVPTRALALGDALEIARRSNPDYLSSLNDRWPARSYQRSSLLNLITPNANISYGARKTAEGTTVISGIPVPRFNPSNSGSNWSLSFGYTLAGSTFANRGQASAESRSVEADIAGRLTLVETNVRSQYLTLIQAKAQLDLAQRALERAAENMNLARARFSVGQGTLIDVRRAEVDKGQAEVNLLTANQVMDNESLRLYELLGIPPTEIVRINPTDSFPVTEPAFSESDLTRLALEENPGIRSLRARETSAHWSTRSAYSEYLPSVNLSASFGGYRQYAASYSDTSRTPSLVPEFRSSGANPLSLSLFVQMPLYDGFQRATQIQRARATEDDARQSTRARELNVRTQVSSAYRTLLTNYQKIALQRANKAASAEALELATQRYRVGSGTYLELLDARNAADQADANYVNAVSDYHKAIATLENAVGRPLR